MAQLFKRGNVWLTREQLFEYNKKGQVTIVAEKSEKEKLVREKEEMEKVSDERVLEEDTSTAPDNNEDEGLETVTQEELDNSELIEVNPMTECLNGVPAELSSETVSKKKTVKQSNKKK